MSQLLLAQISPGDLTNAHADLEGMSNCTKCHDLGKQVSKAKCMGCHTEITDLMNLNRGLHSKKEVITKDCWACHGEHFGRTFQIVWFDEDKFDHSESGFTLKEKHKNLDCEKCHKSDFIVDPKLKIKKKTFLGLNSNCNTCHEDVHQGTLSENCSNCHTEEKFKPAVKFSHEDTKFKLTGAHTKVDCINCHQIITKNSKQLQKFADIKFNSCGNCHTDVHKGNLGKNCKSCHNTNSFHQVNISAGFNHSRTKFPLLGKHKIVKCENCHEGSFTKKIKHQLCSNCHEDFHKGEFVKDNIISDCKDCHNEIGFSPSTFTIERHSKTKFELSFAHSAIPCFACHKKESNWKFTIDGQRCISCHENIHRDEISETHFDEKKCESCHSVKSWNTVDFEHKKTDFDLLGKHKSTSCSSCHFSFVDNKIVDQKFAELNQNCTQCHNDVHVGQFIKNEKELCKDCHTSTNWKPTLFDHNRTRFVLDGAHNKLNCTQCHLLMKKGQLEYFNYKIEDVTCKSCHS